MYIKKKKIELILLYLILFSGKAILKADNKLCYYSFDDFAYFLRLFKIFLNLFFLKWFPPVHSQTYSDVSLIEIYWERNYNALLKIHIK